MIVDCPECGQPEAHEPVDTSCRNRRDTDADVKLDGPPLVRRPRERCTLCGIKDGRPLPDSFRGAPICKECGGTIQMIIDLIRLRTVDVACNAIKDTGRSICEAMHKKEAV